MNLILDYSTFLENKDSEGTKSLASEARLFFRQRGWCPFCSKNLPVIYFEDDKKVSPELGEGVGTLKSAWSCECGWWATYVQDYHDFFDGDRGVVHRNRHAILKKYKWSDTNVPITTVRQELLKKPHFLNDLHSRKVEELVASVFSDFFSCEVKHVGRTGDNGIDLFVIHAEKTVFVQVKRRISGSRGSKAEPVSTVREFLGAVQLSGGKHAILVTTADHFTSPAQVAATRAVTLDLVTTFELVNGRELFYRLKFATESVHEHWRNHLD